MKNEKIKGIKQVCSMSKSLNGFYDPRYLRLFYDISENKVFAEEIVSLGHNTWIKYDNENIYSLGNIYEPMTMVGIWNIVRSWQLCHKDIF